VWAVRAVVRLRLRQSLNFVNVGRTGGGGDQVGAVGTGRGQLRVSGVRAHDLPGGGHRVDRMHAVDAVLANRRVGADQLGEEDDGAVRADQGLLDPFGVVDPGHLGAVRREDLDRAGHRRSDRAQPPAVGVERHAEDVVFVVDEPGLVSDAAGAGRLGHRPLQSGDTHGGKRDHPVPEAGALAGQFKQHRQEVGPDGRHHAGRGGRVVRTGEQHVDEFAAFLRRGAAQELLKLVEMDQHLLAGGLRAPGDDWVEPGGRGIGQHVPLVDPGGRAQGQVDVGQDALEGPRRARARAHGHGHPARGPPPRHHARVDQRRLADAGRADDHREGVVTEHLEEVVGIVLAPHEHGLVERAERPQTRIGRRRDAGQHLGPGADQPVDRHPVGGELPVGIAHWIAGAEPALLSAVAAAHWIFSGQRPVRRGPLARCHVGT
jgi:hypothetical protein